MARLRISEYRAKKILLGETYTGISMSSGNTGDLPPTGTFVVKVDQGIKKRLAQGLVALNVPADAIISTCTAWLKQGFSHWLIEPMFPHEQTEERYLSIELVRDGMRLIYSAHGGVDVEENNKTETYLIRAEADSIEISKRCGIPHHFLVRLIETCTKYHWSFVEINPLIVRGTDVYLLDLAVLVDGAAAYSVRGAWSKDDVVQGPARHGVENEVQKLQQSSSASFSLSVLNPDGEIFLVLSGGGGSLVVLDELAYQGVLTRVANYGEYSGGPTREETYLYTRAVLTLLSTSHAHKKVLVIAGGIANFTDVRATFDGIIDALTESAGTLRETDTALFVRRGGPNEDAGLVRMRTFMEEQGLLGDVYGSDTPLTDVVSKAVHALDL